MTDLQEPWVPDGTRAEKSRVELDALTTARFEKTWPQVERKLLSLLRSMHVPRDRGEDFIQEAAIRVLRTRVRYDGPSDLYPWAALVVKRLAIDAWRREQYLTDDAALGGIVSNIDVAHEVERRLALESVLEAWPSLSDRDRRMIVLAVEERALAVEEAQAMHAARYRARTKLRAASRGLLAWLGFSHVRRAWKPAAVAAVPAAVLSMLLLPVLGTAPRTPPIPGPRSGSITSPGLTPAATSSPAATAAELIRAPAPRRAPGAPSRRGVTRVERRTPTGKSVIVEHEPDATGRLLCVEPGPPLGETCTPPIGPLPVPLPTPLP